MRLTISIWATIAAATLIAGVVPGQEVRPEVAPFTGAPSEFAPPAFAPPVSAPLEAPPTETVPAFPEKSDLRAGAIEGFGTGGRGMGGPGMGGPGYGAAWYEKRLISGVRWDVRQHSSLEMDAGYAFDRKYGVGQNQVNNLHDQVDIAPGAFVSANFRIRF